MNQQFKELHDKTLLYNEGGDCSVKAVAVVLGTSYEDAHNLCSFHGRAPHKGMFIKSMEKAIESRGFLLFDQYAPNVTVKNIPRHYPRGRYLVYTASHVLPMVNGRVIDITEGRRHRVKRVVRVDWTPHATTFPDAKIKRAPSKPPVKRQSRVNWQLRHKETKYVYNEYKRKPKFANQMEEVYIIRDPSTKGKLELVKV